MAEDTAEIREAIEQTREEIGDTIQAIGEKADVKARAGEKLAEGRDAIKGSATDAKAKLGDLAQGVGDSLSNATGPALSTAAEWTKSATYPPTPSGRRRRLAIGLALIAAVTIVLGRHFRQHRGQ
jgi:Protein of unknown function (DUF3618)